ncbi:MAG: chemotaxis protein CheA, partial [Desulfobacterales bacterium]|nr:chemotaxis protein CheA [Desulfobacterales bacterium]
LNDLQGIFQQIENLSRNINNNETFLNLVQKLIGYIEKLLINEESDFSILEEGVTTLQQIWRDINNNTNYSTDLSPLLKKLENKEEAKEIIKDISKDDIKIMKDFVNESLENLEVIEVGLVNLEQDPGAKDTINAIFRAFHTIKGVSGFLNLGDVNKIAHSIENLLDAARHGEFPITNVLIDIILEAVDFLKKIIKEIENSIETGKLSLSNPEEIDHLIFKIESIVKDDAVTDTKKLGEILLEQGAIDEDDLKETLVLQQASPDKRLGEILLDEKKVESKKIISALREQKKGQPFFDSQVKVDTSKLDNLVDQTGELVIAQAMLRQNKLIKSLNDHNLYQNLNRLTQIISGLQKIALSMRMVPIRTTFQKMVRLIRDLSRTSGKEVSLEMSGEDTEIDRNVVDKLYEPLVHMIRNAVDHGLETQEEREKAGKNKRGNISLRAYHKGGNIIIEIEDDGKGLDKDKIIEKAISTNLISKNNVLSDAEAYDLVFLPGFSTADKITDISGRGVGMDVVKKVIENLRGHLHIKSQYGKGSTFIITLPLTLAIIDGMVVRIGEERYIIPTLAIVESFKLKKQNYYTIENKGEMILARGKLAPLIRLDRIFSITGQSKEPWDGIVVVVENKTEQKALLIDELLGKEEIVIKSLGDVFKEIKGFAGGAILGDGRVGLILDIAGLFEASNNIKLN